MKWNIRKGQFPPGTRDDEKIIFEELDLKYKDGDDELKKELGKLGYVEWITYPIAEKTTYTEEELQAIDLYTEASVKLPFTIRSQVAKRKYEIFCGGFLFYHDVLFKRYPKGKGGLDGKVYPDVNFEHKIFFEWFKGKGVNNDEVRIYINITPLEYNSNPPPPPAPPPPES
jgi:hypothetical protein